MPETPSSESSCDVAILGAGPAGLAAALTLRRHAPERSVVVLAAGEGSRRKLGETFPPGAQAMLRSLGVWEAFLASGPLPAYGTCAAWGRAEIEDNEFIFHPDRLGWHLQRPRFDAMLLAEAERTAVAVWRDTLVTDARRGTDRWDLEVRSGDRRRTLRTRFVLDATGRAAQFAERAGAVRTVADQLVAVSMMFQAAAPARDTYTLVEAFAEGWWYSALQPDGRMAVAVFTDADIARRLQLRNAADFHRTLASARHTLGRVAAATADGEPVLRLADSSMLDRVTGDGWLATGDAASTFDPLSSQGVMKALRQGTVAGYAVTDHFNGDETALPKYEALLQREYREFLVAKRDYYRLEPRWAAAPFWSRRHAAESPPAPALERVA